MYLLLLRLLFRTKQMIKIDVSFGLWLAGGLRLLLFFSIFFLSSKQMVKVHILPSLYSLSSSLPSSLSSSPSCCILLLLSRKQMIKVDIRMIPLSTLEGIKSIPLIHVIVLGNRLCVNNNWP